jgi:hypothetical protein
LPVFDLAGLAHPLFTVLLLFEQLLLAGSARRTSQERAADADDNSERSGKLSAESSLPEPSGADQDYSAQQIKREPPR